ncbi:antitoxin of toxin-antitoxin stability system [Nocardiopsis sp. CNT-189]|uniref:antitoxin of toxin-antitoxin stability system n=1 Tax=Nocardiopsis oceanisediminis TaxID=2816862 RepID=UPI003B2B20C3
MNATTELSVAQARDHFSDAVNRAAYASEVTYVTRGRGRTRAAAIVPAHLVDELEELRRERDRREVAELASADARGEIAWHTSAPAPADRTELLAGLDQDLGLTE